jgi:hypothetical protein
MRPATRAAAALVTVAVSVVPGCTDDDGDGARVHVQNQTDDTIELNYETRYRLSPDPVQLVIQAGDTRDVFVEPTATSHEPTYCLVGPLVATADGVEVERLPDGLCWQKPLEWIIDGDPPSR